MQNTSVAEMKSVIERFVAAYDGSSIGASIRNQYENWTESYALGYTFEEHLEDIYNRVCDFLY